jgi:hypothetical protein
MTNRDRNACDKQKHSKYIGVTIPLLTPICHGWPEPIALLRRYARRRTATSHQTNTNWQVVYTNMLKQSNSYSKNIQDNIATRVMKTQKKASTFYRTTQQKYMRHTPTVVTFTKGECAWSRQVSVLYLARTGGNPLSTERKRLAPSSPSHLPLSTKISR